MNLFSKIHRVPIVLCILVHLPFIAVATSRTDAATTAAFVDFDKSAVGQLLEARLLAKKANPWVERASLEQILREQKITSLFSAAGAADRSKLGRIVKADALVLLRTVTGGAIDRDKNSPPPGPYLQLIVCETRHGLRLANLSAAIPSEGSAIGALVARFEQAIDRALKNVDREELDICAVPPFVSNNLKFTYDYLKEAYARVIEQAVFQQNGFSVVELAEAEALSKELLLAGRTEVKRKLPLYLLGDYKHSGEGKELRVQVRLQILRGKQLIATVDKKDLKAGEVPAFLRQTALDLLSKASTAEIVAHDAEAEARQLAERAQEFLTIGDFEEGLALIEAALLLRPDDYELRRTAVLAISKLSRRYFYHQNEPAVALPVFRHVRRQLEHLSIWLTATPVPENCHSTDYLSTISKYKLENFLGNHRPWDPTVGKAYEELAVDLHAWLKDFHDQTRGKVDELKRTENAAREAAAAVTAAARRTNPAPTPKPTTPAAPDPDRDPSGEPKLANGATQAAFTPVTFKVGNEPVERLQGCIPAGPGIDVLWAGGRLFVMKQPGRLRQVYDGPPYRYGPAAYYSSHVVYDGRYVWAAGLPPPVSGRPGPTTPTLIVLDPTTERVREITAADGLPIVPDAEVAKEGFKQYLTVMPVKPGQVCIAGTFGRTWIALATFNPSGRPTFKTIHECRKFSDMQNAEEWRDREIAFNPVVTFGLRDAESDESRVFIHRTTNHENYLTMHHPLVVDPKRETVEVYPDELHPILERYLETFEDSLYYVEMNQVPPEVRLVRIGSPTWTRETLVPKAPQGFTVVHNGQIHIAGKRWWTCGMKGEDLAIAAEVPWSFRHPRSYPGYSLGIVKSTPDELATVCRSRHFGVLAFVGGFGSGAAKVYQATFSKRP